MPQILYGWNFFSTSKAKKNVQRYSTGPFYWFYIQNEFIPDSLDSKNWREKHFIKSTHYEALVKS